MVESNGATRYEHVGAAGSVPSRERTIVARGQLDGVRCVDMLIDTGASCCFIRRSCAERLKLPLIPLNEQVSVTLADRRTTVATHEVRVASMNVHGSKAACALLLLDELSNDVIVGMDWIRQTGLSIRGGVQYDMLNGQPVRSSRVTLAVVEDEWPVDRPVRLSAALLNAASVSAVRRSCESLRATGLDVASMGNSQLRQVLYRHRHVFTEVLPVKTAEQIAQARQFSIVLVGDEVRPVKQRERRLSPAEIAAATQWVQDEVAAGRMEPSTAEWAAQLVIVPKRNEKGQVSGWRICGDYRDLNAVTKADAEPLPLMDSVFDQLAGMLFFSKLDMTKGFNQIPVEVNSRELMAVSTPIGLYQPTVMPFGVKNAPGSFQREMRRVLRERLNRGVFVFIDDIIIYSRTEAEHIELIDWVLNALKDKGYFANPDKCQFLRHEVNFLGHVVSRNGVSMQQHKVEAVRQWPVPQSVKDVRAFLGLAGFYRRFVRNFAAIAKPLTDLTHVVERAWWSWDAEAQKAFDTLKQAMVQAPVLAHADPQRQWVVQTDASGFAIGGVLSQQQDDGTMRPVAYWSHKLNPTQSKYSATERELMAIVLATKHWRAYLHGSPHPVLLKSDHKPLIYLNGKAELGMRLSRWMEELCDLTFEIGYVKGKDNAVADALSRRSDHEPADGAAHEPSVLKVKLLALSDSDSAGQSPATHQRVTRKRPETHAGVKAGWRVNGDWMRSAAESLAAVRRAAAADEHASEPAVEQKKSELQVESLLADARRAATSDDSYKQLLQGDDKRDGLQRRDGLVYSRSGAVYVPNDRRLRTRLLELAHDAVGHFGRARTIERLSRHCVWTGMTKEVEDYCRSCAVCCANKAPNDLPAGLLRPLPIPERVWDSVGVDFVGPLPVSSEGNDCILVLVDRFSKMLKLRPCKTTITAAQTGRLLLDMLLDIGKLPTSIISDRDVRFTSAAWGQLWGGLKVQLKMSSAYHPQTDGQTERANRTMQTVLRAYVEKREDWEEWLPFVAAAYNSSKQESTKRTPFEMNFADARSIDPLQWAIAESPRVNGRADERGVSVEAERTLEEMKVIWAETTAQLVLEQAKQKRNADQHRRDVKYKVGDSVWLSTANLKLWRGKLQDKWIGPYVITTLLEGGVSVELDLRGELGRVNNSFHVSLLRPYESSVFEWPGRAEPNRPPPQLVDGGTEWDVEAIVGKKVVLQKRRVTELVQPPPARTTRSGRVSKPTQAVPTERTVVKTVPVVYYQVRWAGWGADYDAWREIDDLPRAQELVSEYELRMKQSEAALESSNSTSAAMELGVATAVEWRFANKKPSGRRGKPTVRCSYACVEPWTSTAVGSERQPPVVVRPNTSVAAA